MTRLSERMLIAAQTNDAVREAICSILDRVRIVDLTDQEAEIIGTQVPRFDQVSIGPKDDD